MSDNFPELDQFEGLIHFAARHCTRNAADIDDIVQELRIKYYECRQRLAGKCAEDFTKYYKTVIWNHVRSFHAYRASRKVEFNDDLVWDNVKTKTHQDRVKDKDYDDLKRGKNLSVVVSEMYQDGRLLEILQEQTQRRGKDLSKKDLVGVLATMSGVKNCRIMEVFNEMKPSQPAQENLAGLAPRDRYRLLHPDAVKASQSRYRKNNAGQLREYARKYGANNADKIRACRQRYYAEHQDELLRYQAEYRANHQSERAATQAQYYRRNIDKLRQYNAEYYRRNADKLNVRDNLARSATQRDYYCRNLEQIRARRRARYKEQKAALKKTEVVAQD